MNKTKPREPPSVISANVNNGNGSLATMSPPTKAVRASSSHKRGGASTRTASVSGVGVIREPNNNLAKGSGSKYSVYGSIAAKEGKKRSSLLMMQSFGQKRPSRIKNGNQSPVLVLDNESNSGLSLPQIGLNGLSKTDVERRSMEGRLEGKI